MIHTGIKMNSTSKKIRVLIVDDDDTIAQVLAETIRELGVETFIAYDGKQAMMSYLQNEPDMIFCDYLMPEIDGIMLMKSIRALNSRIPFILISGYYERLVNDLKTAKIEPDAILRKPIMRLDKVKEILTRFFPGV